MSNPRKRPPMSEAEAVRDSVESNQSRIRITRQKVGKTLRIQAQPVLFKQVAKAMNHSNVGSCNQDDLNIFLECRGLTDVPHVLMATHSIGERYWEFEDGIEPPFFPEDSLNGGWLVASEKDTKYLECVSATSGSAVYAEKSGDQWRVTLDAPIEDSGEAYKGRYWEAFHEALEQ